MRKFRLKQALPSCPAGSIFITTYDVDSIFNKKSDDDLKTRSYTFDIGEAEDTNFFEEIHDNKDAHIMEKTFWKCRLFGENYYSTDGGRTLYSTDPKSRVTIDRTREDANQFEQIDQYDQPAYVDFRPKQPKTIREIVQEIHDLKIDHPELDELLNQIIKRLNTI